jgi:hypothetical protein
MVMNAVIAFIVVPLLSNIAHKWVVSVGAELARTMGRAPAPAARRKTLGRRTARRF